jgi:16S rRNA (uracil1498-N3)-methyltransferase
MSNRFYTNCSLAPGPATITGPEAHHLAAVCRVRPGDAICLFNGDGFEYRATVLALSRKEVQVDIQSVESRLRELCFRMEVAAPFPKGDRGQFLIEKLTELGATRYTPLQTQRSVVHPGTGRLDKLERHVIEASKQCGRSVLMQIDPVTAWEDYCRREDLPRLRLLAHPGGARSFAPMRQDVAIAVGPEGGFTEQEIATANGSDWQVIDLGPRILRVETAALVLTILAGFA